MNKLMQLAKGRDPAMTVLTTHSGLFWVIDPQVQDVNIYDIAESLGGQRRFLGHGEFPVTVAAHSWLLSELVPEEFSEMALFHDATEAYMMDVPKPLKERLGLFEGYSQIEDNLFSVICEAFNLPFRTLTKEFYKYDRKMGAAELLKIFPHGEDHLRNLGVPEENIEQAWDWSEHVMPMSSEYSGALWLSKAQDVIAKYAKG